MMIPAEWRRKNSIFRKTTAIFIIVALVPVAFLGYRSHLVYSEQLDRMVQEGPISQQEADDQAHEIEEQAIFYSISGLIIALLMGYFFAGGLVRPIRALQKGARRIGNGDLDYRVATDNENELEEPRRTKALAPDIRIPISSSVGSRRIAPRRIAPRMAMKVTCAAAGRRNPLPCR